MKFNSISLKFSDVDEENARLEIIIDPPMENGAILKLEEIPDQPCVSLATKVLAYLNFLKATQQQEAPEEDVGQGSNQVTVH